MRRSGRWTRVYAEVEGKDASHLFYGPEKAQFGRDAAVTLAGIGGVGTDGAYRREGLGSKVLGHALSQMKRDGWNASALYTSRRIVAHRLYRRHGFVDVCRHRPSCKLLDAVGLARQFLSELARRSAELQAHSLTLLLAVERAQPAGLRISGANVDILSPAPRAVDLALRMSGGTLLRLWLRETALPDALGAKLVTWTGDRGALELLVGAAMTASGPVNEE